MKYILILCSSLLLVTVISCRKAVQSPRKERSDFASRIEAVLPPTWTLQESGDEVIISRQDSVTWYPCVSLDVRDMALNKDRFLKFVERNGVTGNYRIRLRRTAKLDPLEYARLKRSNDQIVVTKETTIPIHPEFHEDEVMRSYDPRYRELPEYYDGASSIYVETTAPVYECIYPNSAAQECDTVRLKLDLLFTRYSKDNYRRTLTYGIW
jgi:hypothetical protein